VCGFVDEARSRAAQSNTHQVRPGARAWCRVLGAGDASEGSHAALLPGARCRRRCAARECAVRGGGGMQRGPTLAHLAAKRIQLCGTHVRCGEGEGAHVVSPSNFGDELQRPVCSPGPAQFRARCPIRASHT
jgi:hypothetical protein